MIPYSQASLYTNIQIMLRHEFIVAKGISVWDASFAFGVVAGDEEGVESGAERGAGDDGVDVEDWFGGETGDGGATDVLDGDEGDGLLGQEGLERRSYFSELGGVEGRVRVPARRG